MEEYQGIVKVSDGDRVVNGIVISNELILTTLVDTPNITFYGSNHKFQSRGIIVKKDLTSGLCLIRYQKPSSIKNSIKAYKPSRKGFYRVNVVGWSSNLCIYEFVGVVSGRKMVIDSPDIDMSGFAVLSNNELVGIQTYKSGRFIGCLWYDQIMEFING
jgi:hypothetical protein